MQGPETEVQSWAAFTSRIRSRGTPLLQRLDEFPNSILVTGCQRSGTTILARIISESEGMVKYWSGPDDELDAALILCGDSQYERRGRHCFQTTYLNERWEEYLDHAGHRIVWVVRNPLSTVYSMLYNWRDSALSDTFELCGASATRGFDRWRYRLLGTRGLPRLRRACWTYNAKTWQFIALTSRLEPESLIAVDYDELVPRKEALLPALFEILEVKYDARASARLHTESLGKRAALSSREKRTILRLCGPTYGCAREMLEGRSLLSGNGSGRRSGAS